MNGAIDGSDWMAPLEPDVEVDWIRPAGGVETTVGMTVTDGNVDGLDMEKRMDQTWSRWTRHGVDGLTTSGWTKESG